MTTDTIAADKLSAALQWQATGMSFAQPADDQLAFPTTVSSQITSAVTLANTKVFGTSPEIGVANLYQATAQALANAAHNATSYQQQSYVSMQAASTHGVTTLYSLDTGDRSVMTMLLGRS